MSGALIHLPALQIQPEQQDPISQYGKLASIQGLAAQRQQQQALDPGQLEMQRQQIQAAALENQQRTQALKQTQAMNAAFQGAISPDATTGQPTFDKGKVLSAVVASGNGSLVPQLSEKFNQLDKTAADLADAKDKHATATQDYFGALASEVKQAGYSPGALGIALAHATANGYGQQAQQIQQQYAQNPDSIKQWVDQAIAGSPKQRELAAQEMAAQARKTQAEKQPNETGAQADQEYQQLLTKKNLGQPLTPQETASMQAYEQRKTLGPRTTFNLQAQGVWPSTPLPTSNANGQPVSYDDQIKSLGAKGGVVKAIIDGRQGPPASFAQKSPYWQDVMQKVYQVDPQWSEQRAQIRKAFTTGKDGANIGALNTASVHLDALADAAQALDNGSFRPGNAAFNYVKNMFGSSAPTNFEGIRNAVAGEMASALKGNATDPEIAQIKSTINQANSPKQLSDLVNSQLGIIWQKLNTYKERYEQQIPGDTLWSPVLPSAQAVFQKYGSGQRNIPGKDFGPAPSGKADGATGKLSDGTKVVVKGGRLVAQ